jgi:hypothetical protein
LIFHFESNNSLLKIPEIFIYYNYTTEQLHNSTTTQQHNYTTAQLHNSTTTQQHNSTTTGDIRISEETSENPFFYYRDFSKLL